MNSTKLRVGCVVRRYCDFVDPPKIKWCVVVSENPICFALLINTNVTPYARARPYLFRENLLIRSSDVSFLDHDSYIDCTQIFVLNAGECHYEISLRTAEIKGDLPQQELRAVLSIVENSLELSPKHKKTIARALSERLSSTAEVD